MKKHVLSILCTVLLLSACERTGGANTLEVGQAPAREIAKAPAIQPDLARKKLLYAVEYVNSQTEDVAYIHLDIELTERRIESLDSRDSALAEKLSKIEGLTDVNIYRYKIVLYRGRVFEWPDIVAKVVEIVRQERAPNAKLVEQKINVPPLSNLPNNDFPRQSFGGERNRI